MLGLTGVEQFAITSGATIVAGGVTWLGTRRKQNADSTKIVTDIALSLIDPLRDRITSLEDNERRALQDVATTRLEFAQYKSQAQMEIAEQQQQIGQQQQQIISLTEQVGVLTIRLAAAESQPPDIT